MKTRTYFKPFKLIAFIFMAYAQGQTTNLGDFYITQGTQFSTLGALENTETGTFINDGEVLIYNHFNNDGAVDFTSDIGGSTHFIGASEQQINGTRTSYFYDLTFNNQTGKSAAIALSGDISVAGEVNFIQGIVKNDGFGGSFIFEDDATFINEHDGSHVDGYVQKIGNDRFNYPIGDAGRFRYAAISSPTNASDVLSGKYYLENSDTQYPHANRNNNIELIDDTEFWSISRDSGSSEVLLTLSWDVSTTPTEIIDDPRTGSVHIVRWDETDQHWVDEGGVIDEINRTVTTLAPLGTFGIFTLARVAVATECQFNIQNLLTPNGDNMNDYLAIEQVSGGTQCSQNMNVKIFNRWGTKVFESNDYNENGKKFEGFSDNRATVNNSILPTGTYFYVLTFGNETPSASNTNKKTGYLYINGN